MSVDIMDKCIFCQVVAGNSPAFKVYEDDSFLAFLDIYPRAIGHTLVIPKKHYQWVYDYPDFGKYWEAVLKVTRAVQKALNPTFVTYLTIGIDVPHAHVHILPRYGGLDRIYPEIKNIPKEEMQEIAEKIFKEVNRRTLKQS